jgi:hypothetical protein
MLRVKALRKVTLLRNFIPHAQDEGYTRVVEDKQSEALSEHKTLRHDMAHML